MSTTRHAKAGSPFRQERYASSAEFERGLMANLVAKRCGVLGDPADRELVWALQLASHREGGLAGLAAELCDRFPERVATATMQKLGMKPGQVYDAAKVRRVRAEMPNGRESFLLKGEFSLTDDMELMCERRPPEGLDGILDPDIPGDWRDWDEDPEAREDREARIALRLARKAAYEARARQRPVSYPAAEFATCCREAADALPDFLRELCLDPKRPVADGEPWYFPTLVSTLREHFAAEAAARAKSTVVTEIGRLTYEALDYAVETGRMVLIDGHARIGKTFAVQAWCEQHPGRARYVQVPSCNDETSFHRAIAASLGVSINLNSKAQELRGRIEETLHGSRLLLVLDEAHYLWPQGRTRREVPARLNWIMTSLVNHGVPVALVTTPQFIRNQRQVEQRTGWTSEQFLGRIGHYQPLPDSLSAEDLEAVARALLPEGDAKSIRMLVLYAQSSAKYLAGIDAVVARVRFTVRRRGESAIRFEDVKQAIRASVIPSDRALADALESASLSRRKAVRNTVASPVQPALPAPAGREIRPAAPEVQTTNSSRLAGRGELVRC